MRNDVGHILWAAFTVRRLLALPHCCMDRETDGQIGRQTGSCSDEFNWIGMSDSGSRLSGTDRFSCIFHVAFKHRDELLPRLTKSFASIKIVSATHARTQVARWRGTQQGGKGAGPRGSVLAIRFMCASFALLIFLRCQFMVIFYVPNIKTQKVVLHSPFPPLQIANLHPKPIKSRWFRHFVICFYLLPRLCLSNHPSFRPIQFRFWPPTKRLISPLQSVVASPAAAAAAVPRHSESPRHVESAQSALSLSLSLWDECQRIQRVLTRLLKQTFWIYLERFENLSIFRG